MSTRNNSTACELAIELADRTDVKIVLAVHIVFCILSFVSASVCMKKHLGGILHPNFTILLQLYLFTFILHSLFHGVSQTYQLYLYMFESGCDITMPGMHCFILRHSTHSLIAIMTLLELSITIERIFALIYRKRYDSFGQKFGILLGITSYVLGEAFTLYLMHFSFPLKGYYVYCSAVNFLERTGGFNTYELFGTTTVTIEIVTVTVLLILMLVGKKVRKTNNYTLSTRFEDKQNRSVLRGVLPTLLFHSVYTILSTLLYYAVLHFVISGKGTVHFLFLGIASYTVPTYTFLAPLVLLYMCRKKNIVKIGVDTSSGDHYFETYKKMW